MARFAARHQMAREVEDLLARQCQLLFLDAAEAWRRSDAVAAVLSGELRRAVDAAGCKKLAAQHLRLPQSSTRAGRTFGACRSQGLTRPGRVVLITAGYRSRLDQLKPVALRPQALRDRQHEVRQYRKAAGTRAAVSVAEATKAALDQIELDPDIGSPTLGRHLGIPGLLTWRVAKFPLLWFHFEREDRLDVIRLLGDRQDIEAILGDEFAGN